MEDKKILLSGAIYKKDNDCYICGVCKNAISYEMIVYKKNNPILADDLKSNIYICPNHRCNAPLIQTNFLL